MPFAVSYKTDPAIQKVAADNGAECPSRLYLSAGKGTGLREAITGPLHAEFTPEGPARFGLLGACAVWARLAKKRSETGLKIEYIPRSTSRGPHNTPAY